MKIVYLITGSGGSFYCGNCYRDMLYLRAIRKVKGMTAKAVPLYLPPDQSDSDTGFEKKVFFGAISMYIREKVPFLRNMPAFLDKFFDLLPFLKLAARQAGTTRTEGLEELTLNMIEGNNAFQPHEVRRLVNYLNTGGKPDIVHLSNALILGLAGQLKKHMDTKIVCSLLNEDDWIEDMKEPFRSKAWELIARESEYVDRFITPSQYYKDMFITKTGLEGNKIDVIPLGFDPEVIVTEKNYSKSPVLGYFCRMNRHNGFDKIVDAFIKIKSENLMPDLVLHTCGGYTGDDKAFIKEQYIKLKEKGFHKSFRVFHEFHGNKKAEFFNSVDVISVPVRKYDGYGLYIIEANAAGVPVVQPATGAFPEIIARTGGGITYSPDNIDELSASLIKVLDDKELMLKLGTEGKENVHKHLSLERMSEELSKVYNSVITI